MNSKAEYQQGEVARVVLVRGLTEWAFGNLLVASRRCHPGAEPGRGRLLFPDCVTSAWLIRLSRNSFSRVEEGGREATSHSVWGVTSFYSPLAASVAQLVVFNLVSLAFCLRLVMNYRCTWWEDNECLESLCRRKINIEAKLEPFEINCSRRKNFTSHANSSNLRNVLIYQELIVRTRYTQQSHEIQFPEMVM